MMYNGFLIMFWMSYSALLLSCLQIASGVRLDDHLLVGPPANRARRLDLRPARQLDGTDRNRMPIWDCSDLPYGTASGVYSILEGAGGPPVWAYCDFSDPAGWTVLQRRQDNPTQLSFARQYDDYRYGFGQLNSEFWWGLEYMWLITSRHDRVYELKIELGDWVGATRYALYGQFSVSSHEGRFRLYAANYSGDAGDSLSYHSGMQFSTDDEDNDLWSANCGEVYAAGWWFNNCHESNLNGIYYGNNNPTSGKDGVVWYAWHGFYYSLKDAVMKIRPRVKLT
ncbi:microfibril-associated glycoprotein 4-like [Amphibalanus amphitrite]|uniref:microfibril-associated glycoprotein 4-like n=1 Tax=Amphibalanus amphitrite TaxID=1232801 RepID=UPI001C91589C|nr:microfibril-associated glycoprotein 4-like [Amphibalanus amphitrite]